MVNITKLKNVFIKDNTIAKHASTCLESQLTQEPLVNFKISMGELRPPSLPNKTTNPTKMKQV